MNAMNFHYMKSKYHVKWIITSTYLSKAALYLWCFINSVYVFLVIHAVTFRICSCGKIQYWITCQLMACLQILIEKKRYFKLFVSQDRW